MVERAEKRAMIWLVVVMILGLILVSGCANNAMNEHPEKSSVFLISRGDVSLLYKVIAGGVDYCKITQHNLMGSEYVVDVKYDGDSCTVEATASGQ